MRANGDGKAAVSVDIDGTLADYHGWFLRFAADYFGRPMPSPSAVNPGLPLYRHMGVSLLQYRECKLAYRQGGLKRSMPCLEGAADVLARIRKRAEVWICTTRPFLRLDNIDPDTREWLRRNGIRYDALLFDPAGGDWKYRELKRQAGDRVACVAEDLPEQAARAIRLSLSPVLLRNQPYNQEPANRWAPSVWNNPLRRWSNAEELLKLVGEALDEWNETRG